MRRIQLIGNIVKDSEVKNINGQDTLLFTIAVNNKYTDKNGVKVDVPHYFDCSLWRNDSSKLSNYFKKSTKLYLEGEPSVNIYEKDGKAKGGIRVRVSYFEFLSSTKKNQDGTNPNPEGNDDMPF